VQPNVHCLVGTHSQKHFIFNNLQQRQAGLSRNIRFLEGQIQLSRTNYFLKLDAQPTSKRPECRYQNDSAIPAAGGDITLRQKIVAIRNGFPPS
jgi:hypothetical protein